MSIVEDRCVVACSAYSYCLHRRDPRQGQPGWRSLDRDRLRLAGLKLADAPAGRPLALRATLPEKPPMEDTITVYVPLPGGETACAPTIPIVRAGFGVAVGYTVA